MKRILGHFFIVVIFMLLGMPVDGQDLSQPGPKRARTPDDYQPRTLKEVIALETTESLLNEEKDLILQGNLRPSRVSVTFTGSTRPLPESKKDLLQKWARRFAGSVEHYTVPYQTEMLFIEDKTEHWLAVNKNSIAKLSEQIKRGEAVDLFVIRLAARKTADAPEWLILVENFQKQP
jgi:hypothetical protein